MYKTQLIDVGNVRSKLMRKSLDFFCESGEHWSITIVFSINLSTAPTNVQVSASGKRFCPRLDEDGLPYEMCLFVSSANALTTLLLLVSMVFSVVGSRIKPHSPLYCVFDPTTNQTRVVRYKGKEIAIVDQVRVLSTFR